MKNDAGSGRRFHNQTPANRDLNGYESFHAEGFLLAAELQRISRSNALGLTFIALAIFTIFLIATFLSPRSIPPM